MKNTSRRPKIMVTAGGAGGGLAGGRGAADPGAAGHGPGPAPAGRAGAVAGAAGGARSGENHRGSGGDAGAGRGLPGRYRDAPGEGPFGPVASDPVVSRLVSHLAADAPRALKAIRAARAAARERAWALAGQDAPGADGGLVTVDTDATIVTACSEKEQARPTWKKSFGFHSLTVFADHGPGGGGEPLAGLQCLNYFVRGSGSSFASAIRVTLSA